MLVLSTYTDTSYYCTQNTQTMKKVLTFPIFLALFALVTAFTFTPKQQSIAKSPIEKINWITWEQAVEANKTTPKKIFVDLYTDWCGWCKVMDKETFTVDSIAEYMSKNYYCVKFNAEQKGAIDFGGQKFEFIEQGARGYHALAAALTDGRMSYPTCVYLTENYERVMISPGYKKPNQIMPELRYTAENAFKTVKWEDFKKY